MIINAANWVGENTHTVGTGDLRLGGAIIGFTKFNVMPDGLVYYTIQDGVAKETGIGTLRQGYLERTTIVATIDKDGNYSTSPTPLKLSGNAQVFGTINAEFMMNVYNSADIATAARDQAVAAQIQADNSAGDAEDAADTATAASVSAQASATDAGSNAALAANSADAAVESKDAAASSALAAKTSETNAAASATAANASKNAAATSASNANTSETNAAASATAAAGSKTAAATSATNAKTSETNAKTSETNANNSKVAAATSETNAKTSETNAAGSAAAANASKLAAGTSESNAKASELAAKSYSDSLANAGNFLWRGNLPANADLNTYGPGSDKVGMWSRSSNTNTTMATYNFPEDNEQGVLKVYAGGRYGCLQEYVVSSNGNKYVRGLTAAWNGTNGPWSSWILVGQKSVNDLGLGVANATLNNINWQTFNWSNGAHYQLDIATGVNVPAPINAIAGTMGVDVVGIIGDPSSTSTISWGLFYVTIYANNTDAATRRIFSVVYRGANGTRNYTVVELLGDNKFGSTAGTICQGNDARLNTINGKSGGLFNSRISAGFQDYAYSKVFSGWSTALSCNQFAFTEGASPSYYTFQDFYYSSNTGYTWRIAVSGTIAGGRIFEFRDNGVFLAPTAVYAGGTQLTSDGRLKSNFEQIKYDLNDVDSIIPEYYDKCSPEHPDDKVRELGIVAQKLQKTIPGLVNEIYWSPEYPDLLTINYPGLSAWLVGYCKTLKDEVVMLRDKVSSMEERLAALESSINNSKGA